MPALLIAALIVFLEGMSFAVVLPVLTPLTLSDPVGGTVTVAGLLFALSTGPRVVCAPLFGRVSDRLGRRPTLVIATAGTLAASLLLAWSVSLGEVMFSALVWLLISRLLYGMFAVQSVVGSAIVSDVTTPAKRAAGMGALGAAFGLAFATGPALGGYVAEAFAATTVGYVAAALQVVSLGLILVMLKETHPVTEAAEAERPQAEADANVNADADAFPPPRSLAHLITFPAVAWMLTICLLGTAAYSVLFPTFPALADAWYDWSVARVGAALSVFGLVGAIVQGGLIRPTIKRLGERATAQLGLAVLAIGLLWVAMQPGEGAFWGAAIIMAIGTGFSVPAVMAMLSLAVSETDQGSVHGLTQSATAGGRAIGYLLGGAIFTHISPMVAYATAGVIALAMVAMLLAPLAAHKHAAQTVEVE